MMVAMFLGFPNIRGVFDQSLDLLGVGECETGEAVPHGSLRAELHKFLFLLHSPPLV